MTSKRMDDLTGLLGEVSERPQPGKCERCGQAVPPLDTKMGGWFTPPICTPCVEGERAAQRKNERAARIKAWTKELERQQGGPLCTKRRVELPDLLAAFVVGGGWLEGQSAVYLTGHTGTGKTQAMTEMALRLIERHADEQRATSPVAYVSMQDLLDMLRAREDVSALTSAPWLFLDEIGGVALSDWGHEQVFKLISARCHSERPTVYASNHHLIDLLLWAGVATSPGAFYGVAGWDHRITTRLLAAIGGQDEQQRLPGVITFERRWRLEVRR